MSVTYLHKENGKMMTMMKDDDARHTFNFLLTNT